MPNQFLAEIHDYIAQALMEASSRLDSDEFRNDLIEKNFYAGRVAELQALRRYLSDRFDLNTQKYY